MIGSNPIFSPLGEERPADDIQWERQRGRVECREVWMVDSKEMTDYLQEELTWSGAQLSGRIRRSRRHKDATEWESRETHTWVSSLPIEQVTARRIAKALRGHWTVENGVFRVRDVTYNEDRLHGRAIGFCLSAIRNMAINIIRREGYPYIPDGCRDIAAKPDHGLRLIHQD